MLWIKFPASQFFLPINTHPRKHPPVWQAAFIPRTLHNWWNFSGDSLEAPLNVYLALLTVLGQPPAQLWVSQGRMGQSPAGKQRCQESVITNPQLDRHPWHRILSQLGKVNVGQNLTGFGLSKMKGKADAVQHEKQYLVTLSDILTEYLSINIT